MFLGIARVHNVQSGAHPEPGLFQQFFSVGKGHIGQFGYGDLSAADCQVHRGILADFLIGGRFL